MTKQINNFSAIQWVGIFIGIVSLAIILILVQFWWSYLIVIKNPEKIKKIFGKLLKLDNISILNKVNIQKCVGIFFVCLSFCTLFNYLIASALEETLLGIEDDFLNFSFSKIFNFNGHWWLISITGINIISWTAFVGILLFHIFKIIKTKRGIVEWNHEIVEEHFRQIKEEFISNSEYKKFKLLYKNKTAIISLRAKLCSSLWNSKIKRIRNFYGNSSNYDYKLSAMLIWYIDNWSAMYSSIDIKLFKKRDNYSVLINDKEIITVDVLAKVLVENFFALAYK